MDYVSKRSSIIAFLLIILMTVTVGVYWHQSGTYNDSLIADHVAQLAEIFERINVQCGIIDFEHQKNYIDFLNVGSFAGSEVGSMNLANPNQWKGPYVQDNPTIQEKYYQIVRTQQGHFIVPGSGVKLSSGKVIGRDIVFDEDANIELMTQPGGILYYQGRPLAMKILNTDRDGLDKLREKNVVDQKLLTDQLKNL